MKPWEELLTNIKELGAGGQGLTFIGTLKESGLTVVLKVLKSQKDQERRARMFREVSNLRSLNHPQIPKVLSSNVERFKEEGVKLYFVSEYIYGQDLERFDKEKISIHDKISLTISIAEVVKYCHDRHVLHRDIKPDNILISGDAQTLPHLIDFGISFNKEEQMDENLTPEFQHLGNRFVFLPELRGIDSDKRDERSDLTAVSGILFYLICDEYPTSLVDENGSKPHQRNTSKRTIETIPSPQKELLNNFFDVAFSPNINERWQTAESVIDILSHIIKAKEDYENNQSPADLARVIRQKTKLKANYDTVQKIRLIFEKVSSALSQAQTKVIGLLGSDFNSIQSDGGIDYVAMTFQNRLGIRNQFIPDQVAWPLTQAYITGSELVVSMTSDFRNKVELFLVNYNQDIDWNFLETAFANHYLEEMLHKS